MFASVATAGSPATRILRGNASVDGELGNVLTVDEAVKRREVERFLAG